MNVSIGFSYPSPRIKHIILGKRTCKGLEFLESSFANADNLKGNEKFASSR